MTRPKPNFTFDSSNTRHNIARILAALDEPKTYRQLYALLSMTERSVQRYISHLRNGPVRRVRVQKYLFQNSRHIPLLALGSEPDAKKPRLSETERNALYRARVKASPERLDRVKRRNKARWLVMRPKLTNPWFGVLPGALTIQQEAQP